MVYWLQYAIQMLYNISTVFRFICGKYMYNELAYPIFNETNAFFRINLTHERSYGAYTCKNQFNSIIILLPNRSNCFNAKIKENEKAGNHSIGEIRVLIIIIIIILETNIKILL